MSSNFGKIYRKNGFFLADDIFLDCLETIKVVDKEGNRNGLEFIVLNNDAQINDQWKGVGESQTGSFM